MRSIGHERAGLPPATAQIPGPLVQRQVSTGCMTLWGYLLGTLPRARVFPVHVPWLVCWLEAHRRARHRPAALLATSRRIACISAVPLLASPLSAPRPRPCQVMLHIPDPHSKAYVYATSWWNADTVDQYLRCGVLLACCCQVGRASITDATPEL